MSVAEPVAVQPDGAPDDVLRVEHVAKSFGAITALRDVSMHLRNAFAKLNINSRVELARLERA